MQGFHTSQISLYAHSPTHHVLLPKLSWKCRQQMGPDQSLLMLQRGTVHMKHTRTKGACEWRLFLHLLYFRWLTGKGPVPDCCKCMSEVRQTDLACKQLWHDRYPECQNEEYVGDADVVAARKLVWLTTYLVHVKANREHNSSHAEQNHCNNSKFSCK